MIKIVFLIFQNLRYLLDFLFLKFIEISFRAFKEHFDRFIYFFQKKMYVIRIEELFLILNFCRNHLFDLNYL